LWYYLKGRSERDLNFFDGVIQTEVQVGTYTTRYPVFYRDVSYMSMFLLASPEKVKNIVPSKRMNQIH